MSRTPRMYPFRNLTRHLTATPYDPESMKPSSEVLLAAPLKIEVAWVRGGKVCFGLLNDKSEVRLMFVATERSVFEKSVAL